MVWVALSAAVGIVACGLSTRMYWVAAARSEMRQLRRVKFRSEDVPEVPDDLPGPLGEFLRTVRAEATRAGRVDLLAERMAQVDDETSGIGMRIRMWARVVLFSAGALSLVALGECLRQPQSHSFLQALMPIALGSAVAVGLYRVGRTAGVEVESRRQAWDALSDALLRPLLPEPANHSMRVVGGRVHRSNETVINRDGHRRRVTRSL